MKYVSFHVKNYKGIEELKIDLATGAKHKIFTLVGVNESGKTTILEALNFFQQDTPDDEEHTVIPKSKKGNFNDAVSVSATLELDAEDQRLIRASAKKYGFKIKDDFAFDTLRIEKRYVFSASSFDANSSGDFLITPIYGIEGRTRVKPLQETAAYKEVVKYIRNHLLPQVIYYPNFLAKFPARIYLEEKPGEDSDQEFYRDVLQDILDSMDSDYTIDEHIVSRMRSNASQDRESLNAVLRKVAAKMSKVVFDTWKELFESKGKQITIEKGFEKVEAIEYPYLEVKIQEGSDEYSIAERSLGFTWFFSFLLFTEFRKNRSTERGEILFLIDEPASNLHSTAQTKLLRTFERIVSKSKLVYTTHSHHLINPEWLEGAYIIKNKAVDTDALDFDSQKTDIGATPYRQFAAEHPDQHTYFQPILDTLEYRPSHLEQVEEIVIVEGKNDFYTFKYIHDYVLDSALREKLDLHFYPGNGAGQNDRVIRLYIAWSRKFAVLVDGDKAGRTAKKKYEEEIGPAANGRCLPLNEIYPGWKDYCTEDLFSPPERIKIIKAIFSSEAKYSKIHFNEAIQNLIATKTPMTLSATTLRRFEKIFIRVRAALDLSL